jgi:lectin, mannose-binding 1
MHSLLLGLALVLSTAAQSYLDDFSFGHKSSISPNSFAIPGFSLLGEGYVPQLMSDKVMLTPPYGGNKRGAVWSDNKNTLSDWEANFEFRVGVTDQGSGSLQLWYTASGKDTVSTNDINSVGRFDGLAVVVDTVGGKQKIRGFLNDGSVEYKSHTDVNSLAFGHCDYIYRNLGRPSRLSLKSTSSGLDVTIDDKPCFSTESVKLPQEYFFGITASSHDPPDSFEVFKFALQPTTAPIRTPQQQQHAPQGQQPLRMGSSHVADTGAAMPASPESLTALDKRLTDLYALLERTTTVMSSQFEQLNSKLAQPNSNPASPNSNAGPTQAQFAALDARLNDLSRMLTTLASELKSGDHSANFEKLSAQIQTVHSGVTEHVPQRLREYMISHTPRIGFILGSFMAFQTCCILAWGWYKWRKSTLPKKYL